MSTSARQLQWLAAIGGAVIMAAGVAFFGWPTFTVLAFKLVYDLRLLRRRSTAAALQGAGGNAGPP